jgi:hypothetical protein
MKQGHPTTFGDAFVMNMQQLSTSYVIVSDTVYSICKESFDTLLTVIPLRFCVLAGPNPLPKTSIIAETSGYSHIWDTVYDV